jgi:hypothetical protein
VVSQQVPGLAQTEPKPNSDDARLLILTKSESIIRGHVSVSPLEFDCGTSHRCTGKGIRIIDGDKTVKATRCTNINEGISTSFL